MRLFHILLGACRRFNMNCLKKLSNNLMKIKELQVLKFYYKSFDWLIKSEKKIFKNMWWTTMQRRKLTNTNDAKMLSIEKMRQKKSNSKLNQSLYEVMLNLFYPKGQLISKCLFGVFNFFQKTNENMSTWGIIVVKTNSFVRFFGRIHGLTICFWEYLTFSICISS